ncbi:class I SAM-dependent methyltransferase [Alkalicoccus chagannorensis]|uniref:class I SAM-dependent methyltransferase n=1 Tax=Alkalicoccus chagannorensis TaxID=427072 RepID=UPI0004151265|nr:methyltransferase [Alkalicoccus chagannorensis]
MTDHYYSSRPEKRSSRRELRVSAAGVEQTYQVDHGVFSKGGLDEGSRLLIESFEAPEVEGAFLDAGCGWGPIGISIAQQYPERTVHMIDVNERSVMLASENTILNHCPNTEVRQQDLLEGEAPASYAAVMTNPPIRAGKQVVFRLYEQAWDVLKPGGTLTVVIQKKQGAPSTKKKLEELGFSVTVPAKEKGYFIFRAEKH